MYTIRDFEATDADYAGIVATHNANFPDEPTTVAIAKHNDAQHNQKFLRKRWVVEHESSSGDKEIVADGYAAESTWAYVAGKYRINFNVLPQHQEQGIEQMIYDHILDFLNGRDPKPTILDYFCREDRQFLYDFHLERGYEVVQRENNSALDVRAFDWSKFAGVEEKVVAGGIEMAALPDLQKRFPDWRERFHALEITVDKDMPQPDVATPPALEEWVKDLVHPNFLPDAQFFALDGDQWVGLSTLWKDDALEEKLWVGLTGVLQSHRRKSIATALKLKTIEYAQQYGARIIETENDENNPMYQINVRLGFAPKPSWLTLRKTI